MFGDIGLWEVLILGVLALFIFGPDKLPKAAAEAGRALRQLRRYAMSAKRDLEAGFGPEMRDFDLTDLNPRHFVRKHLFEDGFDDEDDYQPRRPRRAAARVDGDDSLNRGKTPPPYDTEAT